MTNNVAVEQKSNRAATLAESAIQKLADALERGESADLKRYLETMARFHTYSFYNCMLIASQRPSATYVAGFHKWHDFGRYVRKGEKGIAILAPIVRKHEDETTGEKERRVVGFRAVYVFDVTQTDGEPLPESGIKAATGEPGEHLEALKAFAVASNIAVEFADAATLRGARGMSLGGRIQLLTGMSDAETFAVLAHEVAHELLHRGERRAPDDVEYWDEMIRLASERQGLRARTLTVRAGETTRETWGVEVGEHLAVNRVKDSWAVTHIGIGLVATRESTFHAALALARNAATWPEWPAIRSGADVTPEFRQKARAAFGEVAA